MLQRLLYTDIKTYLVELLMKQDNMSMAASIESRVPFLDHVLVEFATRIPREVQLKGLGGENDFEERRWKTYCRDSILYRPKLGFPTPWSGWLAGPRLELDSRTVARTAQPRSRVTSVVKRHRATVR